MVRLGHPSLARAAARLRAPAILLLTLLVGVLVPSGATAHGRFGPLRVSLSAPRAAVAGQVLPLSGRVSGAARVTVRVQERRGRTWVTVAVVRTDRAGRYRLRWSTQSVRALELRALVRSGGRQAVSGVWSIRIAGARAPVPAPPAAPAITPDPQYVSSFSVQPLLGQAHLVLIRYLRLDDADVTDDAAFAAGAAQNGGNGIDAVAVMCGTPQSASAALVAAGITAPVQVDTDPACRSAMDAAFDGITGPRGGPERLFLPSGRPVDSDGAAEATVQAFNLDPARAASADVKDWMDIPYLSYPNGGWDGTDALDVPVMRNIVRAATALPAGDAVVQGFWWNCPTCNASESNYHLEEWATAHPGLTVEAFTCDSDVNQASDFAYEHGWTFPVVVYNGPLSFGDCFDQVQKGQLGDTFYDETNFVEGGTSAPTDAGCEFPDLPDEFGQACATGAWTPSPDDEIAPYQMQVYNNWLAAGGQ